MDQTTSFYRVLPHTPNNQRQDLNLVADGNRNALGSRGGEVVLCSRTVVILLLVLLIPVLKLPVLLYCRLANAQTKPQCDA